MSNSVAFDEGNKKRSADDEEDSDEEKVRKSEATVAEQQPLKAGEENVKADLIEFLNQTVKILEIFRNRFAKLGGFGLGKGLLLHGKPGLGYRVLEYMRLHCKDLAFVFPRDLLDFSASKCDNTFRRAVCCDPSIVLLIGLEHAASDVEQMIERKMRENTEWRAQVIVVGTTAMLAGVSEKLRKSFGVVDIQELADP